MNEDNFLKLALASFVNGDKKYYVKCGKNDRSYLNVDKTNDDFYLDTCEQFSYIKTEFTLKEIIEIIKKDELYLDWSKVKFKEVKENE